MYRSRSNVLDHQSRKLNLHIGVLRRVFGVAICGIFCVQMFGYHPCLAQSESADKQLASDQASVAERFRRLEELLLRSSELEAAENPARAALLRKAVQVGKQSQLADLLASAAAKLGKEQYSEAIDNQKNSKASLEKLLALLQSENREKRVREEREKVRKWIEETNRLLRLQSSLRGRTEGGQDAKQAAGDQKKLAGKAQQIAEDLGGPEEEEDGSPDGAPNANDSATNNPAEGDVKEDGADSQDPGQQESDAKNSEQEGSGRGRSDEESSKQAGEGDAGENSEGRPKDGSSESGKSGEEQNKEPASESGEDSDDSSGNPADSQDAAQGKEKPPGDSDSQQQSSPQGSQSQQGQQSQQGSQAQQGQQGQQENEPQKAMSPSERAQQRIQQAQEKMQEAQKALENAEREGAIEKQREAEDSLREAIEELEEILRQLREEEIERSLASLETRLRRMLEMQTQVYEETQRLNEVSDGQTASRQLEIRANGLALEEKKILAEGERAYLLLKEEGSSAAFPEAIKQLNSDVLAVVGLLSEADVGKLTLIIQKDIVSALEEMVEALVKVQKENKERKQQQNKMGQPPQSGQGEQPLVDKLAELRLIKTLQLRINKRTDTMSEMLEDPEDVIGQVEEAEVVGQLHELSKRQSKIQVVTRDIVVGKGEEQ